MIGIVDYGMGNLRSVQKALQHLGHDAEVVADAAGIAGSARLILPGVGNFADGVRQLEERGLTDTVKAFAASGKPMLGVCMGMQLLFDSSTEDAPPGGPTVPGLGLLPGRVVRFEEDQGPGRPRLKVPHMGWNMLDFDASSTVLFEGLEPGPSTQVYFVHGYYCVPDAPADIAATATYGRPFCAAVHRGNLWATQFHPEKSQRVGLRILDNFARCEA